MPLKYTDIMNIIQRQMPRQVEDMHAETIANAGMNMIWMAYDWRESLGDITPFYLIPGRQDYPDDLITIPSDIHGLRQAFFVRMGGEYALKNPLKVIRQLEKTNLLQQPNAITYMTTLADNKAGYRVHPRPLTNLGAPYYFIEGTYKKRCPQVTAATLTTEIPFNDMYQEAIYDAFLYQAKRLAGAPDAARFYEASANSLFRMASSEGLNDGEATFAPSQPIDTGSWSGGVYGTPWIA